MYLRVKTKGETLKAVEAYWMANSGVGVDGGSRGWLNMVSMLGA
jgi:hypothetical protein